MGKSGDSRIDARELRRYAFFGVAIWTLACLLLTTFTLLSSARADHPAQLLAFGLLLVIGVAGVIGFAGRLLQRIQERDCDELRYQAVIEDQTEFIVRWRPDGTRTFVNEAYCRYFGQPRAVIIGTSFFPLLIPQDQASVQHRLAQLTPTNPSTSYTERVKLNGDIVWQEWNDRGIFAADGRLVELQSVGGDITERRKAEAALRGERDRAQQYLDIAGAIFVAINADQTVRMINRKGAETLGWLEEQIVGKNWFDHFIPEPDRERVREVFDAIIGGDVEAIEYFENNVIARNGELRLVAWHNTLLRDETGTITGTISSGEDITERKQSEAALRESEAQNRAVIEALPDLMFRLTRDGTHLDFHAPRPEMLFVGAEAIIGKNVTEVLPEAVAAIYQQHIKHCLDNQATQIFEYQLHFQDSGLQDYEARMATSGDDTVLAIVRNITERKRDEITLAAQARQQWMVADLGQRALAGHDLTLLMEEVVAGIAQVLAVEYSKVMELLPDGQNLLVRAGVGWQDGVVGRAIIPAGGNSQAGYTLEAEEPVVVEDLRAETRFNGSQLLVDHRVISGMSTVIVGREQPFGVLGAHTTSQRPFTRDDISFLKAIANILATAIERKQAEQDREQLLLAEREQRLLAETLTDVALALTSQISRAAALDAILDQAHRLVPYRAANIMLLEGEVIRTARWRGYDVLGGEVLIANLVQPLRTFQVDANAIELGKPVIVSDTRTDPNWVAYEEIAWVRSNIAMPIRLGNRGLGLLHLDSDVPGQFTAQDVERLAPLAGIAAIALDNAQLYAELEQRVSERTAELSAAQKQTDTILQNVADAIVFSDINNNILYVNPAWERLNGFTFAEVAGKNPRIVNSGETPAALFEDMWQTILSGKVWRGVLKNKRKDGAIYDNELTIAPVIDDSGAVTFFVGIQRDVTETRALDALKTRFVANAAHDLNNPIASLSLRLHLMKNAPDRLPYHIEVMENQIQHLTALVDDLLTLSRLDRDVALPELAPTDLNALVGQIVESQQPLTEHKRIALGFEPAEDIGPVYVDSRQIERVVINLLTNALNYTPENRVVTVFIKRVEAWVMLVVRDTGIGIAPDDLGHIFERFYRSNEARKTAKGTGLGLAIVEEIVDRHQGKIEVESIVGEGTTIRVYLPYASQLVFRG